MSTGDGGDAREGKEERGERGRGGDRIGVGGGDDSVVRIQLAARWSETYAPSSDSLGQALKRFRAAFDYLDAVFHGVEPPDLDRELADLAPAAAVAAPSPPNASLPEPQYAAPAQEPSPPPPPPAEARPWG